MYYRLKMIVISLKKDSRGVVVFFFYWRCLDNWSFPAINPEMPYFSIRQEPHLHVLKGNGIFCSLWLLNGAKLTLFVPAKIFHSHIQTSCQIFPAMEQGKNVSDTGGETIAISSPALNLISCHSCTRVLGWEGHEGLEFSGKKIYPASRFLLINMCI